MSKYRLQFSYDADSSNAFQLLECHHSLDESFKDIYEDIATLIIKKENPHLKNIIIRDLELIMIDANGKEQKIF